MRFCFLFLMAVCFFSCTAKNDTVEAAVYADYSVTAEEGTEMITCLLKFYSKNNKGQALYLEPPAAVHFDGTVLRADSARLSGPYYEVQKPLERFSGSHTIVFTNSAGKNFEETFAFEPFTLITDLQNPSIRTDLLLELNGLASGTALRVLLTDTSFATPDINEIDTVQNGKLTISRNALRNVVPGPVTLYLFKEEERRLKQPPAGGGKLSITYSLNREFDLTDD